MADVITSDSTIQCQHQGTVTAVATAVSAVLFIDGKAVLAGTLAGSTVGTDCIQKPPPATNVQCGTVATQSAGPSSVLFSDGQAVLSKDAKGETALGSPTKSWSVQDAKQDVLSAD